MKEKVSPQQTIEECKANIQEFADKFGLIFELEGECGFGRHCVGLLDTENHWLDYNPVNLTTYEDIPGFYNETLLEIAPKDAYHKHNCVAVLGRDEEAIRQLSGWVDKLKELNVVIEEYETGATGYQAMFSGTKKRSIKINQLPSII